MTAAIFVSYGFEAWNSESDITNLCFICHRFIYGELKYTFEAGLTNPERAVVHILCRRMGMESKSTGRGDQRQVSVYKCKMKNKQGKKGEENLAYLAFSENSKKTLQHLFTSFPPDEGELSNGQSANPSRHTGRGHRSKDDSFCKPSMDKVEIAKKVEADAYRMKKVPNLRQIAEERSKLPIASFKDAITSTLESHQVVLISGETGCGKTTQVPQFLLDHMWGKSEACKIVCTQPRRISAISVAERISYERGENVGDTVGYKIRMETKGGKNSSIMFCTNGILLRVLVDKGLGPSNTGAKHETRKHSVSDLTHIIVDEIHERDRFSDFMLAILRYMLVKEITFLILMSATLDAERFSQYFGGCPIIRVPGFTYPVKTFYLEDVLSILKPQGANHLDSASCSGVQDAELTEDYKAALDEAINLAWSSDEFDPLLELLSSEETSRVYNYQHSLTGASPLMVFAGKGRVGDVCKLLSFGADCHLCAKDGTTALEWAKRENLGEVAEIIKHHIESALPKSAEEQELLEKYLSTANPEHIDVALVERLLKKICTDSIEGAILVFLPGWDEINKIRIRLLSSPFFKDTSKFVILSLHSMVPSVEQKKVFRRPPYGSRKIILSTNISETAVTIDDVVYVIDSGRMKEKNYDPYNNVSTLHSSWVSKASARQREGRAGRCQPGICYHLYSKTRAASLLEFQVPEIRRMPIEELCLQVKLLDPNCRIADFLQKTLDPPVFETIRNAIMVLQEIGALTVDETLTELGQKLGCLPVHPSTSKMLFFAILMSCLDPALTLACASEYRDPFVLPMAPDEKKKAMAARAELASLCGGLGDQLIIITAYDCWERAKAKGQESRFCSQYFLSSSTMNMLSRLRKQLLKELIRNAFIPEDVSSYNLNARSPGVLHAVLVAGMYPMVGKLLPPHRSGQRAVVETAGGAKVRLHPHSSIFRSFHKNISQTLLIFDEITRGDGGMYIRNCCVVGPFPLLLLATEMVVAPSKDTNYEDEESDVEEDDVSCGSDEEMNTTSSIGQQRAERIMADPENTVTVVVDRWLVFESTALDVARIYCLRERLKAAILFKAAHPRKALPPDMMTSVCAIASVLNHDGLSGIPPSLRQVVDSVTPGKEFSQSSGSAGPRNMMGLPPSSSSSSNSFLRTLLSDETQHGTPFHHHKQYQLQGGGPATGGSGGGDGGSGSGHGRGSHSYKRQRGGSGTGAPKER
ncbi:Single-stranded nucleic acid binding R3H [Macleaya cordata]|uniref:RNA helicase n=1 Tax=Macleaya cordata TaxID=56857 RepID=A0A200PVD0_MACCD|nr:Single-stranded nucleic acid binding R3H [Macleaya cordata]